MRALAIAALLSAPAFADKPLTTWVPAPPAATYNLVNSHVIFLNRCANGCQITLVPPGMTDSRRDRSDVIKQSGTLTAFSHGDDVWNQVVQCVRDVMSPFGLEVTDQDPGLADHFEVMVAGMPSQVGLPANTGGIADYPCSGVASCAQYIPNALVFDFDVWGADATTICGTAAQEVAHAWTLDHATPANDPMTYNPYTTPLHYRDASPCGSDCFPCGGSATCTAFGVPCTGSGGTATHVCTENGQATQDEVQTILTLFGASGAQAPMLTIVDPMPNQSVQGGFPIDVTCTSPDGIAEVDFSLDDGNVQAVTTPPYHFTAPALLKDGIHHVLVICGTKKTASETARLDVLVGAKCAVDSDCAAADLCYSGVCLAGSTAPGGIGAACETDADCSAGDCGSDGHRMLCVIPCDPAHDQCPTGFGCISTTVGGVCWLGADKAGGGCCDSGRKSSSGALFAGLGFAALLVLRRRRSS